MEAEAQWRAAALVQHLRFALDGGRLGEEQLRVVVEACEYLCEWAGEQVKEEE